MGLRFGFVSRYCKVYMLTAKFKGQRLLIKLEDHVLFVFYPLSIDYSRLFVYTKHPHFVVSFNQFKQKYLTKPLKVIKNLFRSRNFSNTFSTGNGYQ